MLPSDPHFEPVDTAAWRAVVERDLKGADFARRLVHRTLDGLSIEPLYSDGPEPPPPGAEPFTRGAADGHRVVHGWDCCQVVDHPDVARANGALLEELERGATSVLLRLDERARAGSASGIGLGGVALHSSADLDGVLAGMYLEAAPLHLDAGLSTPEVASWLHDLWESHNVAEPLAHLGFDPLGDLAQYGVGAGLEEAAVLAKSSVRLSGVTSLAVRMPWHAAGASPAQTLGFALASGVAYLRACEAVGLSPEQVTRQLVFHLQVDAEVFQAIASIRALRTAWSEVLRACGAEPTPARVLVTLSERVLTRRDPWVNLLRNTTAVFAGAVGGADHVTSVPFDRLLGQPSADARRIARNTASILLHESHLHRIHDLAGGSWFLETHTAELAEAAWAWLQRVEAAGGMLAALQSGAVGVWTAESADARAVELAKRKRPVVGVSAFANLDEVLPVPESVDVEAAASRVETPLEPEPELRCEPLGVRRDAAPFEALRDSAPSGAVFLANLGSLASHNARSTWITNLLAAGGMRVHGSPGLDGAEAAAEAFTASGCQVAVICGADASYADQAASVTEALRAAGARQVWLAGRPGRLDETLREAGLHEAIYLGRDVLAVLRDIHSALEA